MSQFISNVLNTIGEQEPDLPSIKTDTMTMSVVIPPSSTRERLQFIAGQVDGTIRMYTARPAHEWWKPEMYDEKDIDFYDYEDEDEDGADSDDEAAVDAFETNWTTRSSLLSIRAIDQFPKNPLQLAAASRDGLLSLLDTESGKLIHTTKKSHKCGFEVMKCWDTNLIVAGDEEGSCLGYDVRMDMSKNTAFNKKLPSKSAPNVAGSKTTIGNKNANTTATTTTNNNTTGQDQKDQVGKVQIVQNWLEDDHGDYCTDLCMNQRHGQAIFTSADKYVSSYDIKSGKFHNLSMNFDELTSCAVLKDDELIVTGSNTGQLTTYSWADMDNLKDRFLFQESSVDKMLALDDDTILAATEDGILRILTINPTRVIGVVAVHKSWFTSIASQRGILSEDDFIWANDLVCAASADNVVRFWDIQDMQLVRQNLTNKEKRALIKKKNADWNDSSDDEAPKKKQQAKKRKAPTAGGDDTDDDDIGKGNNKKAKGNQNKKNTKKVYDSDGDTDVSDDEDLAADLAEFQAMLKGYEYDLQELKQSKLREKHARYLAINQPQQEGKDEPDDDDDDDNSGMLDKDLVASDDDTDDDEFFYSDVDFDVSSDSDLLLDSDNDDESHDDGDDDEDEYDMDDSSMSLSDSDIDTSDFDDSDDDSELEDLKKSTKLVLPKNIKTTSKTALNKDNIDKKPTPSATKTPATNTKSSVVKGEKNESSVSKEKTTQSSSAVKRIQDLPTIQKPLPKILDSTEFDGKSFRKAHNHKLSDATSTGFYKELHKKQKETKQKQKEDPKQKGKVDINAFTSLPDISHKLPKVAKLKHGSSNFFGGLKAPFRK